ncbi:MAG: CYTH domain-containing protein [Deltaproteobacteria bacterium]
MSSPKSSAELELKRLLLGEDAAARLLAVLGAPRAVKHQVNHIFDTPERHLSQGRHSLRLRFENGQAVLTAKGPSRRVGAAASLRTEAEANIEAQVAADILAGRRDPLAALKEHEQNPDYAELWRGIDLALAGRPLQQMGHFENQRRCVPVTLPSGLRLEVELDRTVLPGGRVEVEVEIELPEEGSVAEVESWFEELASAAGVKTTSSTPKIARFYAALTGARDEQVPSPR